MEQRLLRIPSVATAAVLMAMMVVSTGKASAAANPIDYFIVQDGPEIVVTAADAGMTSSPDGDPFHYDFEFFSGGYWDGSIPVFTATTTGVGSVTWTPDWTYYLDHGFGVRTVDVRVTERETGDGAWLKLYYKLTVRGATTGGSPPPSLGFYATGVDEYRARYSYQLVDAGGEDAREIKIHLHDPDYVEQYLFDGDTEVGEFQENDESVGDLQKRGGRWTMVLTGVDQHGDDPSPWYRDRRDRMMLPAVASTWVWEAHIYQGGHLEAADVGRQFMQMLAYFPNTSFYVCRKNAVSGGAAVLDELESGRVRVLYILGHGAGSGGYIQVEGGAIYGCNELYSRNQVHGRDLHALRYALLFGCNTALVDDDYGCLLSEMITSGATAVSGFTKVINFPGQAPPYWDGPQLWSDVFWATLARPDPLLLRYPTVGEAADAALTAMKERYGETFGPKDDPHYGYDSLVTVPDDGFILGPADDGCM